MTHSSAPESRPDLRALYRAKLEAVIHQDMDALHEINNKIFYAKLDPADPVYDWKLARHKAREREYAAERKAKMMIEKTGKPLCLEDSLSAIGDAIDSAVEIFERYPCPQHAADLLGLIKCRTLLFVEHLETDADSDEEEAGD